MIEQKTFDASLPGLDDVLERLIQTSFDTPAINAYERAVQEAVQGVVVDRIRFLAANASMPQVRAIATAALRELNANLAAIVNRNPNAGMIAMEIQRFMDRPASVVEVAAAPNAPPGAPIGQPAMNWLGSMEIGQSAMNWLKMTDLSCTWDDGHYWH
jgi:hypothetical protein